MRMRKLSRREFCKLSLFGALGLGVSSFLVDLVGAGAAWAAKPKKGFIKRHEALFYKRLDRKTIQCELCPRMCVLKNGVWGFCRAREAHKGKHYSLVYGNPTAIHIDPIEKKPLYHFLPATKAFSIATAGCNFRCKNCQNWQISQFPPEETINFYLPPEEAANKAREYDCPTIAYTYTEPSIFYEYMLDTSRAAHKKGTKNIYHSNGFLNREPLKKLCKYLDGANVDLKGFSQKFYSKITGGYLDTVLETLKTLKENEVHLEITNLVIPQHNDDLKTIGKMCRWIRGELGNDVPIHFSRFFPTYKLKNLPPTPVRTLEKAREAALNAGLNYAYIGNVPGHDGGSTCCPRDGKILIQRSGYKVLKNNIKDGRCRFCGEIIPGVWG